jgi:DNA-binding response OmpR family regulator
MIQAPRIVLGECDSERRHSVALALREAGYEVVETDDGRDLLAYTEYVAAVLGRRDGPAAIAADSFAIVAAPRLPGLGAIEVQGILQRARWDIPVIILPERTDDGTDLQRLRTLLREAMPLGPSMH